MCFRLALLVTYCHLVKNKFYYRLVSPRYKTSRKVDIEQILGFCNTNL